MKPTKDRMPPLPEGSYTPAQARVAAELVAGPRGAVFGPFVPLLRSPDLLSPLQKAGEYLRYRSALEPRLSEFAILVVAKRWEQAVEWSIHAPIAAKCGVAADHIAAVAEGRRPDRMPDDLALVHDFLEELLTHRGVSDATYARALALFGERGIVDLSALCGYYSLLAMVMNVARTPLAEGAESPFGQ